MRTASTGTWWALGVGIAGLLLGGCRDSQATENKVESSPIADEAPAAVASLQAEVAPAPVARSLEFTGTARAARTSPLSAKVGGILRKLLVREGERVTQGQPLCVIDPTDMLLRSEAAMVAHAQAQEGLANARADLERAEKLHGSKALSDTMLQKAQLGLKLAELGLQAAEVNLRTVRQALADTKLKAPFAGVVSKVMAEEGQMITSMPLTVIMVLVDTDTLEVRVPVPERDLQKVKAGMAVTVSLPSVQVSRPARIDRLTEVVDPMTRSIEAIIRLDNREERLPAGLFAKVVIPLDAPLAAAGR